MNYSLHAVYVKSEFDDSVDIVRPGNFYWWFDGFTIPIIDRDHIYKVGDGVCVIIDRYGNIHYRCLWLDIRTEISYWFRTGKKGKEWGKDHPDWLKLFNTLKPRKGGDPILKHPYPMPLFNQGGSK